MGGFTLGERMGIERKGLVIINVLLANDIYVLLKRLPEGFV